MCAHFEISRGWGARHPRGLMQKRAVIVYVCVLYICTAKSECSMQWDDLSIESFSPVERFFSKNGARLNDKMDLLRPSC